MRRFADLAFGVCALLAILSFWSGITAAFFVPDYVMFFSKAFLGFTGLALILGIFCLSPHKDRMSG